MLAMLSGVFGKFQPIKPARTTDCVGYESTNTKNLQIQRPLLNRRQVYLNGYFPSEEVARSLLESEILDEQASLDPSKEISNPHSGNSSLGASHSDSPALFPTGSNLPSNNRHIRTSFERTDSQLTNVSTSPEQHRQAHRSNSNLASAFAASFSRPFSFSASASSSPPNVYPKKRVSPVGSYLANAPAGVTWGTTSFLGKPSNTTEDPKSAYSLSLSEAEDELCANRKPTFRIKLKNQDQFHNDGYATVPLLDPSQQWRYHAYRESYANMLYIWRMPLVRCELLKANGNLASSLSHSDQYLGSSPLAIGKLTADGLSNDGHLGLDFQPHCTMCFASLKQRNSSQKCPFCRSSQTPLTCLFCLSLIRGLGSPCLSCGHVLHLSCRSVLTASSSDVPGHSQCISGCGCNCILQTVVEVEYPSRRKSSTSITITGDALSEEEIPAWKDASPDEEDLWGDVAYESLAKNLGARYLTPRPSQIWRGGG